MKVVYVAGPFRGRSSWVMEENIRRAERLALDVWRAGCAAICPHANTRFYQGECPDHLWLEGDLEILARCDAIILTEDWEKSKGAVEEHRRAVELRLPIFFEDRMSEFLAWVWVNKGE